MMGIDFLQFSYNYMKTHSSGGQHEELQESSYIEGLDGFGTKKIELQTLGVKADLAPPTLSWPTFKACSQAASLEADLNYRPPAIKPALSRPSSGLRRFQPNFIYFVFLCQFPIFRDYSNIISCFYVSFPLVFYVSFPLVFYVSFLFYVCFL